MAGLFDDQELQGALDALLRRCETLGYDVAVVTYTGVNEVCRAVRLGPQRFSLGSTTPARVLDLQAGFQEAATVQDAA